MSPTELCPGTSNRKSAPMPTDRAYFSDGRVTNTSKSFTYKMAAKTSWHGVERHYVTVTLRTNCASKRSRRLFELGAGHSADTAGHRRPFRIGDRGRYASGPGARATQQRTCFHRPIAPASLRAAAHYGDAGCFGNSPRARALVLLGSPFGIRFTAVRKSVCRSSFRKSREFISGVCQYIPRSVISDSMIRSCTIPDRT